MALIVVADDEYLLAIMLADILEDEGQEVITASHGQDALDHIRARKPALVITDFMMPVMTGLELALAIRSEQAIADLPIILIRGAQGNIDRQHRNLFVGVLDRPCGNDPIVEVVRRVLDP